MCFDVGDGLVCLVWRFFCLFFFGLFVVEFFVLFLFFFFLYAIKTSKVLTCLHLFCLISAQFSEEIVLVSITSHKVAGDKNMILP